VPTLEQRVKEECNPERLAKKLMNLRSLVYFYELDSKNPSNKTEDLQKEIDDKFTDIRNRVMAWQRYSSFILPRIDHFKEDESIIDKIDRYYDWCVEVYHLNAHMEQNGKMPKAKRLNPKRKGAIVRIESFMKQYCNLYKGIDLKSRKQALYKAAKKKTITLPKPARKYAKGKPNVYYANDLKAKWPIFCKQVDLPPLTSEENRSQVQKGET
jgi:hypothetical protein